MPSTSKLETMNMEDTIRAFGGAMEMVNLPWRLEGLLRRHGSMLPKGAENEIPLIQQDIREIIFIHLYQPQLLEGHAMTVRCWMTEVRELAYDMEDCIDLYEHAAAVGSNTTPRRRNITRRRWSMTRSKKIHWISEKLKQRLWMANKIREFSLRTQEALQRHKMMCECDNRGGIATARGDDAPSSSSGSGHHPTPCTEYGHVGIDAAMKKIEEWLTDREEKLKVISIVGVAGVGKTTLANEIYRKLGRQFDCRAFVRCSQKPDMRRLLIGVLSQIRPHQPPHSWKVHNLISTIRTHLQHKRYLIIIDDLWATSTLDIIKYALPDGNNCSRILATTEIEDLALQSCGYDSKYIFKMKPLDENDSRNLFLSTVFGSSSKCPPELTKVSYDIARKCAGVPLAIVTIGRHLASQHEKQEHLDYINKSLGYSLMTSPTLDGMKHLLNLIYNNLPHHLKACMLYLSMYQEDYIIWKEDLVKQWMAEGFICAAGGFDKETNSGAYFDELVDRNIIQPMHINDNGEVLSCVVHSVVLNFITYKSIGENFMIVIDHSQATTRHADKVRRLSIQFGNVEDATPPNNMRLSQVQTLAFFGVSKCMPYIMEFQLLKVLVLHLWGDEDSISFDLARISDLFRLRYLQVTSNVTLKLQTHMQGLQYLETLKIDGKIVAVPSDIVHLPRLLHLNLPAMTNLPNGIVHMTSLRTLGFFDLSCNSMENMRSLGELTNLRDLQLAYSTAHSDNLKNNMQCLGSILGELSNLEFLTLSPADSSHANTLHVASATSMRISADGLSSVSSPPPLLQRIELSPCFCIFSKLPKWIGQLDFLRILKIGVREVASTDVDVLGGLLALTVLSLYVHEKPAERIVFNGVGFSVLKYFKFRCSFSWLKFEVGAMPNLRKLKLRFDVHGPDQHDTIPVGMEHLSGLEEIFAKAGVADDLCRKFAESTLDNVIKMHPRRPSVNKRYVDWTFHDNNVGIREEEHRTLQEQQNIINEGSTEKSAVVQNEPSEGAHKSVRKRKRKDTYSNKQLRWLQSAASSEHSQDKQISTITSTHSEAVDAQEELLRLRQYMDAEEDPEKYRSEKERKEPARMTRMLKKLEELDDGFSWRKYGQKDILGAKHPRCYYRCTHRNSKGCMATRHVQRTDDDPSLFNVVYLREHTCGDNQAGPFLGQGERGNRQSQRPRKIRGQSDLSIRVRNDNAHEGTHSMDLIRLRREVWTKFDDYLTQRTGDRIF
ncbi:hypothetical protein ABZP36_009774 [Zizania latifolia]